MSVFKLPQWVIQDIDKIRRNFLWRKGNGSEKGISLANWEMVCRPKEVGGLGIIDLTDFNDALLAKWYWLWNKSDRKIWKSLFISAYELDRPSSFPNCNFFNITLRRAKALSDCFTRRILGNGASIQFWNHNWGKGLLYSTFTELYKMALDRDISYQEVIQTHNILTLFQNETSEEFDREMIQFQALLIEQRNSSNSQEDDAWWNLAASGAFSVKSAYKAFKNTPRVITSVKKIWKLKVPPRMQIFGWLTYHGKILTAENLQKRGWNMPSMCVMCRAQCESIIHLFTECNFVLQAYQVAFMKFGLRNRNWRVILENVGAHQWIVKKKEDRRSQEILLLTMFICWRERCSRIFTDKSKRMEELVGEVYDQWRYIHN